MNRKDLKISIITVCLNSIDTLEQTIQSVVSQDYPNIEYIIVDGGSTDGTLDVIHKYETDISRWISEPDAGIYDAMNKGITMATGDYIAFLNSDDWYTEGALSYVADDIMKFGASVSSYNMNVYSGNDRIEWEDVFSRDIKNIRIAMCRCHQAIFAKRSLFEAYGGFDTKYKISADYDWLLRLYDHGVDIRYKSYAVVNFRLGGLSDSRDIQMRKEAKAIAILALDQLRKEKKMDEAEYDAVYDKIIRFYEKSKTDSAMKRLMDHSLALKDADIHKKLKELLGENTYTIFGSGGFGIECFRLLRQLGFRVGCFWDNDPKKWGTSCEGIDIKPPYEIVKGTSKIIVSTEKYFDEISKQLADVGLEAATDYIDYNEIRRKIGDILEMDQE